MAEIVPPAKQKAALAAVLDTLSVDGLRFPDRVLSLIPPTAFGYGDGTAEPFDSRTNPTFDPIGAATIAADVAVSALLQPQRAARVNEHASRNAENPSFSDVVTSLVTRTWGAPRAADRYGRAIQGAVETLTVTRLMELAADPNASADVRASATEGLRSVMKIAKLAANAHTLQTRDDITRFLNRPADVYKKTDPLKRPPASQSDQRVPVGSESRVSTMSDAVSSMFISIADVTAARRRIAPIAKISPLVDASAAAGRPLWLKCESLQPGGAFKIRGAYNMIAQLSDEQRRRGVITYSSGNHGQAVAIAARDARRAGGRGDADDRAGGSRSKAPSRFGAEVVLEGTTTLHRRARPRRGERTRTDDGAAVRP